MSHPGHSLAAVDTLEDADHCQKQSRYLELLTLIYNLMPGSCVPSADGRHYCEIWAWCPVENDEMLSLEVR